MARILHAADFHLDSAFGGLTPEQARQRRQESRRLPQRLVEWANDHGVELLLLAGDLFDSDRLGGDTASLLAQALAEFCGQVVIAPGNHDPYTTGGAYGRTAWPDNVHIFTENRMETVTFPHLRCAVHGGAFTAPEHHEDSVLTGFTAPEDGLVHIGLLHGELTAGESRYRPLTTAAIAQSNLHYLALGHVHGCTGVLTAGSVPYGYCGCIEGRGFDETGDKGFLWGDVTENGVSLRFLPFARRRYRLWEADITEGDVLEAIERTLPSDTGDDVCRLRLVGSPEEPPRLSLLEQSLSPRFFALQLRDETTVRRELWERCGEDTLRGLFLRELRQRYDSTGDEQQRRLIEQAARFGTAAMDNREV